jgi:hypothetical protein
VLAVSRSVPTPGVAGARYFDDFAAGFRQVRPLRDADLTALPWCQLVSLVANLHFHLVDKPRLAGTGSVREGLGGPGTRRAAPPRRRAALRAPCRAYRAK